MELEYEHHFMYEYVNNRRNININFSWKTIDNGANPKTNKWIIKLRSAPTVCSSEAFTMQTHRSGKRSPTDWPNHIMCAHIHVCLGQFHSFDCPCEPPYRKTIPFIFTCGRPTLTLDIVCLLIISAPSSSTVRACLCRVEMGMDGGLYTYKGDGATATFSARAFLYQSVANDTKDLTSYFGIS